MPNLHFQVDEDQECLICKWTTEGTISVTRQECSQDFRDKDSLGTWFSHVHHRRERPEHFLQDKLRIGRKLHVIGVMEQDTSHINARQWHNKTQIRSNLPVIGAEVLDMQFQLVPLHRPTHSTCGRKCREVRIQTISDQCGVHAVERPTTSSRIVLSWRKHWWNRLADNEFWMSHQPF